MLQCTSCNIWLSQYGLVLGLLIPGDIILGNPISYLQRIIYWLPLFVETFFLKARHAFCIYSFSTMFCPFKSIVVVHSFHPHELWIKPPLHSVPSIDSTHCKKYLFEIWANIFFQCEEIHFAIVDQAGKPPLHCEASIDSSQFCCNPF